MFVIFVIFIQPFGITRLVLSHNPLGNAVCMQISSLIMHLPQLKTLAISDCNFTTALFNSNKKDLMDAFSSNNQEKLFATKIK